MKIIAILCYVACVALATFGLFQARKSVVATYGGADAQSEWQQWRDVARDSDGPVARKEPKSDLPPAYVLMRDHFNACLGFSLLMTSILFATVVFMIRGAFFYEHPADYQLNTSSENT